MAGAVGEIRLQGRTLVALFFAAFLARFGMGPLFWPALSIDPRNFTPVDFAAHPLESGGDGGGGQAGL